MTYIEKRMVQTYSGLLEGLSSDSKVELIENLSRSLESEMKATDTAFYKSFGAFACEKSPKEIIREIKAGRKFREKEIHS